jgi:hypothetical protein
MDVPSLGLHDIHDEPNRRSNEDQKVGSFDSEELTISEPKYALGILACRRTRRLVCAEPNPAESPKTLLLPVFVPNPTDKANSCPSPGNCSI